MVRSVHLFCCLTNTVFPGTMARDFACRLRSAYRFIFIFAFLSFSFNSLSSSTVCGCEIVAGSLVFISGRGGGVFALHGMHSSILSAIIWSTFGNHVFVRSSFFDFTRPCTSCANSMALALNDGGITMRVPRSTTPRFGVVHSSSFIL